MSDDVISAILGSPQLKRFAPLLYNKDMQLQWALYICADLPVVPNRSTLIQRAHELISSSGFCQSLADLLAQAYQAGAPMQLADGQLVNDSADKFKRLVDRQSQHGTSLALQVQQR